MRQSMGKRLGGNKQLLMDDADLRKLRDANFLYHSAHNRAMVFNMSFEGSCSVCLPVCVCVVICNAVFIMGAKVWRKRL